MNEFVHLHLHSEYSLLDGACRISDIVKTTKELGQNAVAVTDHGNLFSAALFYIEATKNGVKPIIGCEVYVARRSCFDKVSGIDVKPYHLVLLCENNLGYQNLIKLVSLSYSDGFYGKPRVDRELLEKYSGGLIALSGCIAGEIPQLLLEGNYERAKETALFYQNLFGENNFFLEIQNHNYREELLIIPQLKRLSLETKIPLVATNDAHYITKADAKTQRVLIAIQTNTLLSEKSPLNFSTDEFYLKNYDEMLECCKDNSALVNTVSIANRCNVTFEFGNIKLPKYKENTDSTEFFLALARKGFKKRYGDFATEKHVERLEYELETIVKMGYVDYFLIVWDFIKYARDNDIPVGAGRGSGAGSIVAYSIGITNIDPLKYSLLFERFLNPERVTMPDFDIDFCYERRSEVIDYVVKKYHSSHVAQIITFGTMAARAAIRDVGRVMDSPYKTVDAIAKLIPNDLKITLKSALEKSSELKKLYENDSNVKEIIDIAMKLEGMPRHSSIHAAGILISDKEVSEYVPTQISDGAVITQYTMGILEQLGLLKMDFLGLRTLTVIHKTVKSIQKNRPDFTLKNINLTDENVFKMISDGNTSGVFQFESAGMRNVLMQLKPNSIEDLIAVVSLYRPGPMDSIPRYISNRHNPDKITYKHPLLEDILDVTYGCIVYQEQVMQICQKLGGYSFGQADLVRRAMAKKKADVMEKERAVFVAGAEARGVENAVANSIFDEMSSFASYAFNKSHAAAYSTISYETAYLKCHFPNEFAAALMTSVVDNKAKLLEYITEFNKKSAILKPNINTSFLDFTVEQNSVRFGLIGLKNLGVKAIETIISEREKAGKFTSFQNFCKRISAKDVNKKSVESLIKSGAFDDFSLNRHEMVENYDKLIDGIFNVSKTAISGQIDFFGELSSDENSKNDDDFIELFKIDEYSSYELLSFEKEICGIYLSGHPLDKFSSVSAISKHAKLCDFTAENCSFPDDYEVNVICSLLSIKPYRTKKGGEMAFAEIEDKTGSCELIIFSDIFTLNAKKLTTGSIFYLNGRLSFKDGVPKIIAKSIIFADDFMRIISSKKLFLRCNSSDKEKIEAVTALARKHIGSTEVLFYFMDTNTRVKSKSFTGISLNDDFLSEIIEIFGCENLAFS